MKRKTTILQKNGTFNFASKKVESELFENNDFFDHEDLMQVKYEMLRAVEHGDYSIAQSCAIFGLSRPAFYRAQKEFIESGVSGMLPKKRGPKGPHKLNGELLVFIEDLSSQYPDKNAVELLKIAGEHFEINVHPRTISRALKKFEQKKRYQGVEK